jgi:16S rRNA (cytidine1402-2'-O)-methyltransferase
LGILYIVATPIGNLDDMSMRAIAVLKSVQLIAAEDTRQSMRLLQHFNISTSLVAYHDHNEKNMTAKLINMLKEGKNIALISDAGTPLISDPGYFLVKTAHENHISIEPIPGACALIAGLSAAGISSVSFIFEGFLPAQAGARKTKLETLKTETRTLVFYETPHRIEESLKDLSAILGETRQACFCRELTKTFETIRKAPLGVLYDWVKNDANQTKGEYVLIVEGATVEDFSQQQFDKAFSHLKALLDDIPLKKAVKLAAELFGVSKNMLYDAALQLQREKP